MDKKNEAINGTSSSTASSKPNTATSSTSSSKRSNCAYTRPTYTTPQEVLDTASIPAKPSRKIEFEVFDGENAEIRVEIFLKRPEMYTIWRHIFRPLMMIMMQITLTQILRFLEF